MIFSSFRLRSRQRLGYTLVELLVAIAIILVLAALTFSFTRKSLEKARSVSCLNRLNQAGTTLTSTAIDQNLRVNAFKSGSGNFDFRPYMLIRDNMGLPTTPAEAHYPAMKEIMYCPTAPDPKSIHWNTYGVNFQDSAVAGAFWKVEKVTDNQGRTSSVNSLQISSVENASDFILLADSCRNTGQQMFRISGKDLIGLRHSGKANAFFLDGSCRSLSEEDLGHLGFEEAYDTSITPPKQISLPQFTSRN